MRHAELDIDIAMITVPRLPVTPTTDRKGRQQPVTGPARSGVIPT